MSAKLLPTLMPRWFDSNGDPLAGGKLYSYIAGTTTPASTYTDQGGLTPNANPVVLDANGEADIWLGTGSYKFILTDSDDVTQWTVDNVSIDGSEDEDLTQPWVEHAVTDGQAATSLTGETVNFASYSSSMYEFEIIRGTTVIANGQMAIQNLNATGQVVTGASMSTIAHGVTFTVVNSSAQIWQLKAALSSGPGNGTIKLRKSLVPN